MDLKTLQMDLSDKGKLIEAGWIGMRIACVPVDAPDIQVNEMRMAFMAGANHLFGSIMSILDPGAEPTEKDMQRMDLIDKELRSFAETFELKFTTPKGSA